MEKGRVAVFRRMTLENVNFFYDLRQMTAAGGGSSSVFRTAIAAAAVARHPQKRDIP